MLRFIIKVALIILIIRLSFRVILDFVFWAYESIYAILSPKTRKLIAQIFKLLRFWLVIWIVYSIWDMLF